ncbi:alpha/beta fold hydrolase [Mangrovimicrobium sediminis]|uniref:Alpha/beta fold hydrolase n=1 Tax=Mangrovimicrobium sediminis TaxID=2562682 RepID=A0A4Z0M7S2_9GAMM|nr:alpha/beta fold hydrolase [Haliea sp. SAOS-164]TGD75460.1 alpha/beta fold hydrolase [Haliea sp. SAOS-164]
MSGLEIRTLGELAVLCDGEALKLPASRRTRALLAYLALTGRPHRRDRLCELLWEIPDDPRAALRWSLSKLRQVVNDAGCERLRADRERVELEADDLRLDIANYAQELEAESIGMQRLEALVAVLSEGLLEGIDIPDQPLFQEWLHAEREDVQRLRGRAVSRLATHSQLPPGRAVALARSWLDIEPFSVDAAHLWLARLEQFGQPEQAAVAREELTRRFNNAGIAWSAQSPTAPAEEGSTSAGTGSTPRQLLARQKIQFCRASDEVNIAYASVGSGPSIVKAANWLSHLELDWDAPIWSPLFRELARDHRFIRYDERGNGLSDWDVGDISFDAFVADLETVVDTLELDRFALLGISQGAAVSIEYAVRHPERVSRLVLFGGYPAGWRIDASADEIAEREAVMTLTATGWGRDNPAYRQIFSSTFMPGATAGELAWFNDFQRATTSAENAVRFLSAFGDIDVREQLARVRVPTLVIHSAGDRRIPLATGREIATRVPGAEFLSLDSDGHLLLGREPASEEFVAAVREFLARDSNGATG